MKSHQKLSETLKNLLYCVSSCPSYVAKDLLKVLQGVNSEVSGLDPLGCHGEAGQNHMHAFRMNISLLIWGGKHRGGEKYIGNQKHILGRFFPF